jgi:hypothetical protein
MILDRSELNTDTVVCRADGKYFKVDTQISNLFQDALKYIFGISGKSLVKRFNYILQFSHS